MRIFADCADLDVMRVLAPRVTGFTTNPTLMRAAGVTDYEAFAREAVERFPGHPISLEVVGDDMPTMAAQARVLADYGPNVYVKIPVSLTNGTPTDRLVRTLVRWGVKVNVTAVFTQPQINDAVDAMDGGGGGYVSVFAGRIADSGRDPVPTVRYAVDRVPFNVGVIWASAREVLNVRQAEAAGAHAITLTPDLVKKLSLFDRDLGEFSLDTVKMFRSDALAAGLEILTR